MTRQNGTPSGARTAGKTPDQSALASARPTVPPAIARRAQKRISADIAAEMQVEPLELRARAWHFEMIGGGCECFTAGAYPCQACEDEAADLLQLLRSVMDETIEAYRRVQQRTAAIPPGRRL
jgi:hypothetical protein